MGEVVKFPKKHKLQGNTLTTEEIASNIEVLKTTQIKDATDYITDLLYEQLPLVGCSLLVEDEDDDIQKHLTLVVESVVSLLMYRKQMHHPFHDLVDDIFNNDESETDDSV